QGVQDGREVLSFRALALRPRPQAERVGTFALGRQAKDPEQREKEPSDPAARPRPQAEREGNLRLGRQAKDPEQRVQEPPGSAPTAPPPRAAPRSAASAARS